MVDQSAFVADLDVVLSDLRALLIAKNEAYGDPALDPVRILIIDDKLKRVTEAETAGESVFRDLTWYFVLLAIRSMRQARQ